MFHAQIKTFKTECFSRKTLIFQQHDVIIYDIGVDFKILFALWNSLVMSYTCAKFHFDMMELLACFIRLFCAYLDQGGTKHGRSSFGVSFEDCFAREV